METANDFGDDDKESINSHWKLMSEATYINQAFSQQVLSKSESPIEFEAPRGPFATAEETPAPGGGIGGGSPLPLGGPASHTILTLPLTNEA